MKPLYVAKPSKPTQCACGTRHPSFNRDGGLDGTPWRCRECDVAARPLPRNDPFAAVTVPANPAPQGSLL